jgi:hypothetical protein
MKSGDFHTRNLLLRYDNRASGGLGSEDDGEDSQVKDTSLKRTNTDLESMADDGDEREDGINVRAVGIPAKRKAEEVLESNEEKVQDDEAGHSLKSLNSFPTRKCPSTPTPISRPSLPSPFHTTDILSSDEDDWSDLALSVTGTVPLGSPVIINDAVGLQLGPLPREDSRWIVNDIDISKKMALIQGDIVEIGQ